MGMELVLGQGPGGVFRGNPSRDIAHFWPQIVALMSNGLIERNWERWYRPLCQLHGVHEGHLLRAMSGFEKAMSLVHEPDIKSPLEALEIAGFLAEPWPAQLVVAGKIGQGSMGAWWAGFKSAFHVDESTPTMGIMKHHAEETRKDLDSRWGANA